MFRPVPAALLVFALAPAYAELPSLMPDAAPREARPAERRAELKSVLRGFDAWRRGALYLPLLGRLDYRLDDEELRAGFRWGTGTVGTAFGYDGERRLELRWSAEGGALRIVYEDDGTAGSSLRLEFAGDL